MGVILRKLRTRWLLLLAWWSTRQQLLSKYESLETVSLNSLRALETAGKQRERALKELQALKDELAKVRSDSATDLREVNQQIAVQEGQMAVMRTEIEGLGLVIEDLQEIRRKDIAMNVARRMQALREPPAEDLIE